MNKAILVGRLTKDPEARYTEATEHLQALCITRYTLAVDRKKKGETDFIKVKAFGKAGEFADKYFKKGLRVAISGRIETGSYTNREGHKVYTTEIVVEDQEFAQSRNEEVELKADGAVFTTVNQTELPFS